MNCYGSDNNECYEMMADWDLASMPPFRNVTNKRKALEPYESLTTSYVAMKVAACCSATKSGTPSQDAHKNFDVELYPDANQPGDIHYHVVFCFHKLHRE